MQVMKRLGAWICVASAVVARQRRAPPAAVMITAHRQSGGKWQPLGEPLVVEDQAGSFYKVVTRSSALRDFTVSNDVPERAGLALLISPSIGFSERYGFHVENGRFVRD